MFLMDERCQVGLDPEEQAERRVVQVGGVSLSNAVRVPRQLALGQDEVMCEAASSGIASAFSTKRSPCR